MENRFTNQQGFRKGHLVSHAKNAYQDPTFLSFVLVFDIVNSPLLNKEQGVKFLRDFYGETDKAIRLEQFIDTLLLLNKEMPWYWKSVTGVDRAITVYENFGESYHGGDDAVLEITCLESINLAISGLMDLYRQAMYDSAKWTQVLPENMRKFRMQVIVSEVKDQRGVSDVNENIEKVINSDLVNVMPKFAFEFDFCEFKPESASEAFSNLSSTDPAMADDLKITISYEKVGIITSSSQYLNGMVLSSKSDEEQASLASSRNPLQAFGDRIAQEGQDILQSTKNALGTSLNAKDPKNLLDRPENVYGSELDRLIQRASNAADNFAGRATRIPDNLYRGLVNSADDTGEGFKRSISTNIFGTQPGQPVESALRRGAIQSIFPMINTQRSNLNPGTNIFE